MKLKANQYYKLATPSGWDFYTGKTINYRDSIGRVVRVPDGKGKLELCTATVLHASKNPNDCFIGARIPCSAFVVEGRPVVHDKMKAGFKSLKVVKEIKDLDGLFGWRYSEAINPIHPLQIKPSKVIYEHVRLLREWASVWDSVRDSVGDSVEASVRDSVWDSVRVSVWASVGGSIWDSAMSSVKASASDSVWAYIGYVFAPAVKKWKYVEHKRGEYPFQSAVDLWKQGLVPSYDRKVWRLHAGPDARIVLEISGEELRKP